MRPSSSLLFIACLHILQAKYDKYLCKLCSWFLFFLVSDGWTPCWVFFSSFHSNWVPLILLWHEGQTVHCFLKKMKTDNSLGSLTPTWGTLQPSGALKDKNVRELTRDQSLGYTRCGFWGIRNDSRNNSEAEICQLFVILLYLLSNIMAMANIVMHVLKYQ